MFGNLSLTAEQIEFYKKCFENIYDLHTDKLHKADEVLEKETIPAINNAMLKLAPLLKAISAPNYETLNILTSFGSAGLYWGKDTSAFIYLLITRRNPETATNTVLHELVHLFIENPIIQKYKISMNMKEALVRHICVHILGIWQDNLFQEERAVIESVMGKAVTPETFESDVQKVIKLI